MLSFWRFNFNLDIQPPRLLNGVSAWELRGWRLGLLGPLGPLGPLRNQCFFFWTCWHFHTDNMKKTNDGIRLTSKRNHLYPGHARKMSEAILTYANKACPLGQYPRAPAVEWLVVTKLIVQATGFERRTCQQVQWFWSGFIPLKSNKIFPTNRGKMINQCFGGIFGATNGNHFGGTFPIRYFHGVHSTEFRGWDLPIPRDPTKTEFAAHRYWTDAGKKLNNFTKVHSLGKSKKSSWLVNWC